MKSGFWKSIRLFLFFRKTILSNKTVLLNNFGCRTDYICRIYTVLNVPKEFIEEPYNLRTTDIDSISQNYIKLYATELQNYLNQLGLRELFDFYEMKKVDKYSYLLVFGFSLFNTRKMTYNLLYLLLFLTVFGIFFLIYNLFS